MQGSLMVSITHTKKAVLQICKYLKGTQNDGLIVHPSKDLQVNCYKDANFAGLYEIEDHQDTTSVKPRTELMAGMGIDIKKLEFISKSTVYEDNNCAIRVVAHPRLTST
eukprot:5251847-Ditylum_brightwellii.AAC.1